MGGRDFHYLAEKLGAARRDFMIPHPRREAESIAAAFHECLLGLMDHKGEDFGDSARRWVQTIQQLMDTSGIQDSGGRGTWAIKAETLTVEEKFDLSLAVDELAYWCDRESPL